MSSIEVICDNLSKSYSGKSVFKNFNFKITNRQSVSITGRNGSGKSTLVKILSELIQPTSGKVKILENDIPLEKENRFAKTGVLAPYVNLYEELSGFENLVFFYKLRNENKNNTLETVNFFLNKTGLYDQRNELLKNYSSGMKQKLKIAFAIMTEPEILILDEPRTNLDSYGVELINEITEKQKEKGILIVATNEENEKKNCDITINIEDYK